MKRSSCYSRRDERRSKTDMDVELLPEMESRRLILRSNKRSRVGETPLFQAFQESNLRSLSFKSVSKANLSGEAGVKPLSPEKRNKQVFCRKNESYGEFTPEIFRNERGMLKNVEVYFPQIQSFPESFFVFKNQLPLTQSCQEDVFSRLPDEMILRVLHWVPRNSLGVVAKVNRRLNRLSQDETLWKRVDATGRTLSCNHLNIILARKPVYARFALTEMTGLHPEFKATCNQLTHLDLTTAQIKPSILAQLFLRAPSISHLSLEHLTLSEDAVIAMVTFARNIEVLNLAMTYDIPALPLATFLSKTEKLHQLNLSNIKQQWTTEDFTEVIKSLPSSLDKLNIAGFRALLKDSNMQILTQNCNFLTHLDVSDGQDLTVKSLEYIVAELHRVQHLALSRCYSIDPTGYHQLTHVKTLKFLQLFTLFKEASMRTLSTAFAGVKINSSIVSTVARPTTGNKRSSIWDIRVRD